MPGHLRPGQRAGLPRGGRRGPARRADHLVAVHRHVAGGVRVTSTDVPTFTLAEWFVFALARTITPQEAVFHGFGGPSAQGAMHVARRTHAPDMVVVEGAMSAINPDPPFIPPTSN